MPFKPTRIDRKTQTSETVLGMVNDHGIHFEAFGELLIVSNQSHQSNLVEGFQSALGLKIYSKYSKHGAEYFIQSALSREMREESDLLSDARTIADAKRLITSQLTILGGCAQEAIARGEIMHELFDYMHSLNLSANKTYRHTLQTNGDNQTLERFNVEVSSGCTGLAIDIDGYETLTASAPILLEHYNGKLRLVVWADPHIEDPTSIIDLEPLKVPAFMTKRSA